MTATTHHVATTIHGRYLVRRGTADSVLVGFHGYAESADVQLDRLAMIPAAADWTLVSIEGLHRFYRGRSQDVVASWMTRRDRDLMIADNTAYVGGVVAQVRRSLANPGRVVLAGFSQGVSMAFRAACSGVAAAVIGCGGDVPPELTANHLAAMRGVLIGRGAEDEFYTAEIMRRDAARLQEAAVAVEAVTFAGGHHWTPAFADRVGAFLTTLE